MRQNSKQTGESLSVCNLEKNIIRIMSRGEEVAIEKSHGIVGLYSGA